jgi:hypothetical protein
MARSLWPAPTWRCVNSRASSAPELGRGDPAHALHAPDFEIGQGHEPAYRRCSVLNALFGPSGLVDAEFAQEAVAVPVERGPAHPARAWEIDGEI